MPLHYFIRTEDEQMNTSHGKSLKIPNYNEHWHSHLTTWWNMVQHFVVRSDLSRSLEIRQNMTCFKVVHIQGMTMYNHILLDWHFSTIEVFRLVNLKAENRIEDTWITWQSYFFSTFSISESVASSTGSGLIANPVTALGRNFLTAPEAFAELIRLFRPSTRLKRGIELS